MNKRIKELRKALGLTMDQFGKQIGLKKSSISQIESGSNNVSEQCIVGILKTNWNGQYVNEEWLRSGSGSMFLESDFDEQLIDWIGSLQIAGGDSIKRRLLAALMRLDDSGWSALDSFVDFVADKKRALDE